MEEFNFMSQETFKEIISFYNRSLKNEGYHNIHLINQDKYENIKNSLLGKEVQNVKFRRWARSHFCYITMGNNHIVHVLMNERKKKAKNNINKNVNSLPILIEENMYKEFCLAYLDASHKKTADIYDKLHNKWENINRKLVTLFCKRCSICAIHVNRKFNNEVAGKAIIIRNFLFRLQV